MAPRSTLSPLLGLTKACCYACLPLPFHMGSSSLNSVFHTHPDSSYQMSLSLSIFISKLLQMITNQSFLCGSIISFGGICRNALFRSLHVGLFTGIAITGPVVMSTLQLVSSRLRVRVALYGICLGVGCMNIFPMVITVFVLLWAMYENYIWGISVLWILFVFCDCGWGKSHY